MLNLFNFVAVALLKGTALAMIPGAIALAVNALKESGTEGTSSPSTTPKQTREIQQLNQRPEVTEAQAQAFEGNDPLAPQLTSRRTPAAEGTEKKTKAQQQDPQAAKTPKRTPPTANTQTTQKSKTSASAEAMKKLLTDQWAAPAQHS